MADKSQRILVSGIAELRNGFAAMDSGMDRAFSDALKSAADVVARDIQQRMPFDKGDAARSVKPKAIRYGASVSEGGGSAPYVQFLDFGGTTGRGHKDGRRKGSVKREWLGRNVQMPAGRYMYPAITDDRPDFEQKLLDAVGELARREGFEVTG